MSMNFNLYDPYKIKTTQPCIQCSRTHKHTSTQHTVRLHKLMHACPNFLMPIFVNEHISEALSHLPFLITLTDHGNIYVKLWLIKPKKEVNCLHLKYCCVHCCVNNSYESKIINACHILCNNTFQIECICMQGIGYRILENFCIAKSLQISHFLFCRKSVAMPHWLLTKIFFAKHFKLAFSQNLAMPHY